MKILLNEATRFLLNSHHCTLFRQAWRHSHFLRTIWCFTIKMFLLGIHFAMSQQSSIGFHDSYDSLILINNDFAAILEITDLEVADFHRNICFLWRISHQSHWRSYKTSRQGMKDNCTADYFIFIIEVSNLAKKISYF